MSQLFFLEQVNNETTITMEDGFKTRIEKGNRKFYVSCSDEEDEGYWTEDATYFEETPLDEDDEKVLKEMNEEQKDDGDNYDGLYIKQTDSKPKYDVTRIESDHRDKLPFQEHRLEWDDKIKTIQSEYILNKDNINTCIHKELTKYDLDFNSIQTVIAFMVGRNPKLQYTVKFDMEDADEWKFIMQVMISAVSDNQKTRLCTLEVDIAGRISDAIFPIRWAPELVVVKPYFRYFPNEKDHNGLIFAQWFFCNTYTENEMGISYLLCNLLYKYDRNNPYRDKQENVFEITKWKLCTGKKQFFNHLEEGNYFPYHYIDWNVQWLLGYHATRGFREIKYIEWDDRDKCINILEMSTYKKIHEGSGQRLRDILAEHSDNKNLNGFYPESRDYKLYHITDILHVIINGNEVLTLYDKYRWRILEKKIIKNLPRNPNVSYNICNLGDFWTLTADNASRAFRGTTWVVEKDWSVAYQLTPTLSNSHGVISVS